MLYLPRHWEDSNPQLTFGHPLFDFPEQQTFDHVTLELTETVAQQLRKRAEQSVVGRLTSLAAAGSCKNGLVRLGRRGRRSASFVSNSTKLMTLRPTHLLGIRDLSDCLRCCRDLPGCKYVTYAPRGLTECSLYRTCSLDRLVRQARTLSVELTKSSLALIGQTRHETRMSEEIPRAWTYHSIPARAREQPQAPEEDMPN